MCDTHAPGGIIQILRDRYDQMGAKVKTPKNPSLALNLTAKKSHAKFRGHKNFQKALNDIT